MPYVYDARVIANYFLDLSERDRIPIFPLKMQKLIYLAHGWSLALRGFPLIEDQVEAWKYGPVVANVYHAFKKYGSSAIREHASAPHIEIDMQSKSLIEAVWKSYAKYTGVQLSALTHEPGYAWDLTMRNATSLFTPAISNALIADEFQKRKLQQA